MATTFKAAVYADNKKQDGTYNVKIRVTHNRRSLKISTNYFVDANDLTRGSLKIKSQDIIDNTDDLIRSWRKIIDQLGSTADNMNVKEIVEYIREREKLGGGFKLNFIEYGKEVAERKSPGTKRNYLTALNALLRYTKDIEVDISKITSGFLQNFEDHLNAEPKINKAIKPKTIQPLKDIKASTHERFKAGGRAISLYMECIRSIHNTAKSEYNDEDIGIINIPLSPFKKYKVKQAPAPKKRATTKEVMQSIINLPNDVIRPGNDEEFVRRDLARDCFILSFALAGMNAVDLYNCPSQPLANNVIIYNRTKTKNRRTDRAEMQIRIEPCIASLIDKYKDVTCERLFTFHNRYTSSRQFNDALRHGLKRMEEAISPERHITFYTARHN